MIKSAMITKKQKAQQEIEQMKQDICMIKLWAIGCPNATILSADLEKRINDIEKIIKNM